MIVILSVKSLLVALAALTMAFQRNFVAEIEDLVDFIALDKLAHTSEIVESEVALALPIEQSEALIHLVLMHGGTQSLCTLPELVLVHLASLDVMVEQAVHARERGLFHGESLPKVDEGAGHLHAL